MSCLNGDGSVQLPLPANCAVAAVQAFTEMQTLLLCSVGGIATLFLYKQNGGLGVVWRGKGPPERHGLAVGHDGVVWVTQNNHIVELRQWRPYRQYPCPAPGALSVNARGRVLVACGVDGLRDSLLEPISKRPPKVYAFLFDVVCLHCLMDGTVLVADCGADMQKNAIKLVSRQQVIRTIRVVECASRWIGISCAVDKLGQVSVSDVKGRGIMWLYTTVAAGTSLCPRFVPNKEFLCKWPSYRNIAITLILSVNRFTPKCPLELFFHILALL